MLQKTARYKKLGRIFNFPFCYSIDFNNITSPTGGSKDVFKDFKDDIPGVNLLKLHGSLNWYSIHKSVNLSPNAMFDPSRNINLTRRKRIHTQMNYISGQKRKKTLPLIVPPVTHKSAILHDMVRPLWGKAEKALENADEILIFGYSCPPLDFESSNLIQRSLRLYKYEALWIIDPNPHILVRYAKLLNPRSIGYFPSAEDYLLSRH
jgi:hypothetical protein